MEPSGMGPSPKEMLISDPEKKRPEEEKRHPFDGIIVFGHGYAGNRWNLSWEAKARTLGAYQLYKEGLAPKIIFTGGHPSESNKARNNLPEELSSADLQKRYVQERFNVPEEDLLIEDDPGSIKTVDNVALALNAMEKQGLPTDNFITVSTGFHLQRITEIMNRFDIPSQPVSAETALGRITGEHAEKMREVEIGKGLSEDEVQRRYLERIGKYDRMLERLKLKSADFQKELQDEPKWQEAMKNWGYYGPLLLAVRGKKLHEIIERDKDEIQAWLDRHPDIVVTIEDLIEGNFDYRELVEKGREVPN